MISVFVVLLSFVLIVVGMISLTKRAEMDPHFSIGFRVPTTLVSRRMWRKMNRLAGVLTVIIGFISLALGLITNEVYALMFTVSSLSFALGSLSLYSSRILEKETGKEEGGEEPIRTLPEVKVTYKVIVFAFFVLTIATIYLYVFYPALPDILAVHFDIRGKPNYFISKDMFTLSFLLLFFSIVYVFSSILLSAQGTPLPKEKAERILTMVRVFEIFLIIIPVLFTFVIVEIVYYNLAHKHFLDLDMFVLSYTIPLFTSIIYVINYPMRKLRSIW